MPYVQLQKENCVSVRVSLFNSVGRIRSVSPLSRDLVVTEVVKASAVLQASRLRIRMKETNDSTGIERAEKMQFEISLERKEAEPDIAGIRIEGSCRPKNRPKIYQEVNSYPYFNHTFQPYYCGTPSQCSGSGIANVTVTA